MVDGAHRRARALERAKQHRTARAAQAELRRMGRAPGPLLGAVQRLDSARQEAAADGDKQTWP